MGLQLGFSTRMGASGGVRFSSGAVATTMINDTIWDAKGDLAIGTGSDAASRLAVTTTAGRILVKDSAASTGVAWATSWYQALMPTGILAETFPRWNMRYGNEALLTSGTLYLASTYLPKDETVTSITFYSSSTALASGNNQWFALYDSSLNLLRQTTDDTSTAWASASAKTLNLTSTYTTSSAGMFYLGIMVNATTVPTLRATDVHTDATIVGMSPAMFGTTNNTGLTTTAPNPATGLTTDTDDSMPYAYCS